MKRRTWYGTLALIGYVLLGLGGCAIQPGPVYTKDGKQYGVTSSQFWRGTWWQHYERALSYADGEFWDDAIAGFQAALATRLGQKDQRRANTYGLHFIDNYFPHRELGIVYYRLKRYPDALHELTTSLDQVESAKAKFYLNKVRKVLLQQGGRDTVPPRIVLDTPPDGLLTNRFTVHVTGHAEDDTYVSTIAINGQPQFIELAAPRLPFTEELILQDGPNTVDIVAEDLLGKQATQRLTIHLDRYGPLLSLEQVEHLGASPHRRVRVQGMVSDHSRVTRFVLAGQHVPLQSETASAFSREVQVAAGAASLPFEVEDAAGNITRGAIALAPAASRSRETFRWKAVPPALPRWASLHAGTVLSDVVASPRVPLQMAHNHDRDPPRITLASLEDQEVVYDDTIYLEGKVTDASAITAFSIAGEPYWRHKCEQLFFGYLARLRAGQSNGFILEATDEWGNRSEYPVRMIHKEREYDFFAPYQVEVDETNDRIYLLSTGSTPLIVLNRITQEQVATLGEGVFGWRKTLGIDERRNLLYIATASRIYNRLLVFDGTKLLGDTDPNNALLANIVIGLEDGTELAGGVAVDVERNLIYVANCGWFSGGCDPSRNALVVVRGPELDEVTRTVLRAPEVVTEVPGIGLHYWVDRGGYRGIALDPQRNLIYVPGVDSIGVSGGFVSSGITVLDGFKIVDAQGQVVPNPTAAILGTIPFQMRTMIDNLAIPITSDFGPGEMVFNAAEGLLYVVTDFGTQFSEGFISVIDSKLVIDASRNFIRTPHPDEPASLISLIATLPAGIDPAFIALDTTNNRVMVSNQSLGALSVLRGLTVP